MTRRGKDPKLQASLSKAAALIFGDQPHHLDHLAPLAIELNIPLILTKAPLEQLAKKYYPNIVTHLIDEFVLAEKLTQTYTTLFSSLPRPLIDQIFFLSEHLYQKRLTSIWCPHGNSDKGHLSYLMEGLQREKVALVYGKKMIDFLREKQAYDQLDAAIVIGNYRHRFYQKERAFYQKIIKQEITSRLGAATQTVLYAPTWQDSERSSSFFTAFPRFIDKLPKKWNLIVKPHPNLLLQEPHKSRLLLERAKKHPRILILDTFPPIYPLLDAIDIYLGDLSSIGYDCLAFNKPMIFLNQTGRDPSTDPGLFLFRCGQVINQLEYDNLFFLIEKNLPHDQKCFQERRKGLYTYVFGENEQESPLKVTIRSGLDGINPS